MLCLHGTFIYIPVSTCCMLRLRLEPSEVKYMRCNII